MRRHPPKPKKEVKPAVNPFAIVRNLCSVNVIVIDMSFDRIRLGLVETADLLIWATLSLAPVMQRLMVLRI